MRSLRDAATAVAFALATLAPKAALACPACAGRNDGSPLASYAVGGMMLFPFVVSLVGWAVLRRLNQDSRPGSLPPVEDIKST